jgi:hypothetical protein
MLLAMLATISIGEAAKTINKTSPDVDAFIKRNAEEGSTEHARPLLGTMMASSTQTDYSIAIQTFILFQWMFCH